MEVINIPAPETDQTRYARERLMELEQRYRIEAEPFVKILADHAARSKSVISLSKDEALKVGYILRTHRVRRYHQERAR